MTNDINKAILIGRLGGEPEFVQFTSGEIAKARLATSERFYDKQTGNKRESTQWHNLVLTGPLAGIARKYLFKGQQIYVDGKILTRSWKDHQHNEKSTTEIKVSTLKILEWRENRQGNDPSSQPPNSDINIYSSNRNSEQTTVRSIAERTNVVYNQQVDTWVGSSMATEGLVFDDWDDESLPL